MDEVAVVRRKGWFGRMAGSLAGLLIGLVLLVSAIVLLSGNEANVLATREGLIEGQQTVVPASAGSAISSQEGALIHVAGLAQADRSLTDPVLGLTVLDALALRRTVEMFQWEERKNTTERQLAGGGTEKVVTYSYAKGWFDRAIDSRRFQQPDGHVNPGRLPWEKETWFNPSARLGGFQLSDKLLSRLTLDTPVLPDPERAPALDGRTAIVADGVLQYGDPGTPAIGDVRVRFAIMPPQPITVVARQAGQGFAPWQTSSRTEILLVEAGSFSAEDMFEKAHETTTLRMWLLRFAGFVLTVIGVALVLNPIRVAANIVPVLGQAAGVGIFIVALLIGTALTIVTVAIAWIAVRPAYAIAAVIVSSAMVAALFLRRKTTPTAERPPPFPV